MSYRISFTSGSLISSFCLSIKGRHDTPSLSFCSDGNKSDLALYVYEILLFLSAPYGGRLLNLTVGLLTLPAAACECQKSTSVHHRHSSFIVLKFCLSYSVCLSCMRPCHLHTYFQVLPLIFHTAMPHSHWH